VIIDDAQPIRRADNRTRPRSRRWLKPGLLAAGVFFAILTPVWAPPLLATMDFFHVRHVEIKGTRYLDPADVLRRMHVDTTASVWDGTARMRGSIANHPLVREVRIERKLPGTLVVYIEEHAPVALVPSATGFLAYDARGVALPIDPTASEVDVPIASTADSRTLRLLGELRATAPALYRRLSEVRRDGPGELIFVLDSLPVRTLIDVTLQRLTDLGLVERDLARRHRRATELDLRYRDQVIARLQ
jgi:cell division protein FtsQ